MDDSGQDTPSTPVGPLPRWRRFFVLCLQVGLLSLAYAAWLGLGRVWRLPYPPGLLAMLSLLGLLLLRVLPLSTVQQGAGFLLRYIGLLFVPVSIGAVRQLPVLKGHSFSYAALIVAGALVGQATAGLLAQALCKKPTESQAPEGFAS
jgi:holin-like protein